MLRTDAEVALKILYCRRIIARHVLQSDNALHRCNRKLALPFQKGIVVSLWNTSSTLPFGLLGR